MKEIKTKETVRDIRVLDRQSLLKGSIREGYVRSKEYMRKASENDNESDREQPDETVRSYGEEARAAAGKLQRRRRTVAAAEYGEEAGAEAADEEAAADSRIKTRGRLGTSEKKHVSRGDLKGKTASGAAEGRGIKTVASEIENTAEKAAADQVSARRSTLMVRNAVESLKETAETAGDTILKGARWVIKEAEDLYAAVMAGGWVSVSVIAVICIIGLLAASPFGIFLAGDDTGSGKTLQAVIREINEEFLNEINSIKAGIAYDDLKISGGMSPWSDVLAMYAVKTAADTDGSMEVVTVTDEKAQILADIFRDMNSISYTAETYEEEIVIEPEEEGGEEKTETVTRTRLLISVSHKTADDISREYGFSREQNTYLSELQSERFRSLWSGLIGGYSAGMGIIPSEATWIGLNGFVWPLPINGTITSGYGYRRDPFTGEEKFHGGTDIAAAEGTPIVAVDDGIVTVANGSDIWGGGYGYYVKIEHLNGYETLYGHCSYICVTEGQSVRKGEVIAYVGSTGNSTGNHLHFEVYRYGSRQDPMGMFMAG